jgi:hypothetical protein
VARRESPLGSLHAQAGLAWEPGDLAESERGAVLSHSRRVSVSGFWIWTDRTAFRLRRGGEGTLFHPSVRIRYFRIPEHFAHRSGRFSLPACNASPRKDGLT